jgi:hypothetical protein
LRLPSISRVLVVEDEESEVVHVMEMEVPKRESCINDGRKTEDGRIIGS